MKKKLFFIGIGILIAAGSVWYIFNGGTDESSDQNSSTSSQSSIESTPVAKDSLPDILKQQKNLKIFNELIVSAGLLETLQGVGPYTVLAPTDDAFKDLPESVLDTIKKPENKTMLTAILNYHIIKGNLASNSFQSGQKLPTLNGQEVIVEVKDGKTMFVDAKGDKASIEEPDLAATNGTVHIISAVLLPQ